MSNIISQFQNNAHINVNIHFFIGLGIWSDGCSISQMSTNRTSIKMITMHITHSNVTINHVFPIGLGDAKDDLSDMIWNIILKDLKDFTSRPQICYVPKFKALKKIQFFIAYAVQDRPEYSDYTGTKGHQGKYSKIPGYSCLYKLLPTYISIGHGQNYTIKPIISCLSCFSSKMEYLKESAYQLSLQSNTQCNYCYDFHLNSIEFQTEKHYPIIENVTQNNTVMTKELSYKYMENTNI